MNHLSRSEEFILLAIWKLQQDAYTLPIQERLSELSGRKWSLSSVYAPLERLEKKGMIRSVTTEAIPERGGRPKRIYSLTPTGCRALIDIEKVAQSMWAGISSMSLREELK